MIPHVLRALPFVAASLAAGLVAGLAAVPGLAAETVRLADGDYRIVTPEGPARGAFVFLHGYRSSAELVLRDQRPLVDAALAHGLAFVAVDGRGGTWSIPNAPARDRDEQAFLGEVLDDLAARHGFTAENTLIGGFSQGASLAWHAACAQGGRFAGMVTFAGVFWNPPPAPGDCVGAIPPVVHFHGIADRTFPLAGRPIGTGHHQGDAFESLAILRAAADCPTGAAEPLIVAGLVCETVPGCRRGAITLCLHPGGHAADAGQLDAGLTLLGF